MVGHATIRIHRDVKLDGEISQLFNEESIMPVIVKNCIALITTINHMIAGVRIFDSKLTSHAGKYIRVRDKMQE